jgi:hypothetical protein
MAPEQRDMKISKTTSRKEYVLFCIADYLMAKN